MSTTLRTSWTMRTRRCANCGHSYIEVTMTIIDEGLADAPDQETVASAAAARRILISRTAGTSYECLGHCPFLRDKKAKRIRTS